MSCRDNQMLVEQQAVQTFSNYTQLNDDTGTLKDTRDSILYSNNHSQDQNGTPGSLNPSGNHGIEASFLDGIDNARNMKQFLVKYYSGGSKIETWDKDESYAVKGTGNLNNWDKLIASIENVKSWANTNGYILDFKGFIWWQGESNASNAPGTNETHKSNLKTLIQNVRDYLNKPELPVCLIQIDNRTADDADGTNSTRVSTIIPIREAQSEVADEDSKIELIETEEYVEYMDYEPPSYSAVHWETEAYVRVGYDTATRMDQIIEGTLVYLPPSPLLWLDASDEATITDNGAATRRISEWRDKSGNGYHAIQPTSSRRLATGLMTINSLNAVKLESGREMFSLTPASANWQDVYIVSRWDGNEKFNDFVGLFTGSQHVDSDNGIQGDRNSKDLYGLGWGDTFHINGTESSHFNVLPTLASTFIISLSSNYPVGINGYCIGNDRRLGSRNWRGPVGEILCFDRKLSDQERQEIEGYLAHKWGIQEQLPENHPFKTSKP